jgi:hypothetical protein
MCKVTGCIVGLAVFTKDANYKKRVVVQNKLNLLRKIFCEAFKHYNS